MDYIASIFAMLPLLMDGAIATFWICLGATIFAFLLALVLFACRMSSWRPLRGLAIGYGLLIRGLPTLILLFLIYFGLPLFIGMRIPAHIAGIVALGLNGAGFMAAVLVAATSRIPKGQFEASWALGLHSFSTWRFVIFPQLLPVALPALVNEVGFIIKGSPLLSLITIVELTRRAQQIAQQTFDPLAPLLAATLLYFVLIGSISLLSRLLENRIQIVVR